MLYELNARGCLIQRHVDQIRLRVDDHTPDGSNEIIPVNKEPVVPPMLPKNTEESIPNKLNKNLPPVSTAASVHVCPPICHLPSRKRQCPSCHS